MLNMGNINDFFTYTENVVIKILQTGLVSALTLWINGMISFQCQEEYLQYIFNPCIVLKF